MNTATAYPPPHAANLADHEALARRVLDNNAWAYFAGGAGDEHTLRANAQAWSGIPLLPRVLNSLHGGHTQTRLLGKVLAHPVLVAPMAYQRLAHPDGELACAQATAAQGSGLVLSAQASTPLEDVAQAYRHVNGEHGPSQNANNAGQGETPGTAHNGLLCFQLALHLGREAALQQLERAQAAGYEAIVITADAPAHGVRDRERRVGFALPPHVWAVNLPSIPPVAAPPAPSSTGTAPCQQPAVEGGFHPLLQHAPTWADVRWLIGQTRLPVLLKGILHPDDARTARDCGAAGVIVSNHGGRTLDTAIPTALALPRVAKAVGTEVVVLADGGIRRGTDIFKALALGAQAVLVGRPCIWGLAHGGALGVAQVLRLLRDELEMTMALCGCATLAHISVEHLDMAAARNPNP